MQKIKLEEAKVRLPDLIEAAIKGEEIFILRNNQPVVQLVPVETPVRQPQFGSAAGLITMADDFDTLLEDFREYMP